MHSEMDLMISDAGPVIPTARSDELRAKHKELLRGLATILARLEPNRGMLIEVNAQIAELESELATLGSVPDHPLKSVITRGL